MESYIAPVSLTRQEYICEEVWRRLKLNVFTAIVKLAFFFFFNKTDSHHMR
jgi:hypothetical protein